MINANQVEALKYLHKAGFVLDIPFNEYLNNTLKHYKAFDCIAYLIEQGLEIKNIRSIPIDYKIKYPHIAEMVEKRMSNIFEYTIYLATQVHPKLEGKKKEAVLEKIAELSSLPYVIKMSKENLHE